MKNLFKLGIGIFLFFIFYRCNKESGYWFNLGFEHLDKKGQEVGWEFPGIPGYTIRIDSIVRKKGKYSLSIKGNGGSSDYKQARILIDPPMNGDTLVFSGYLRTKNVSGSAALWIRINGYDKRPIALNNMHNRKIFGTHDWKKYILKLPYNAKDAQK